MRKLPLYAAALFVLAGMLASTALAAVDSRSTVARELSKPVVRGGIVYKTYCAICHGERGDGKGRASKLYSQGKANLAIRSKDKRYLEKIIRKGGKAFGKSSYMPMWEEELSDEQIKDVLTYLRVVGNQVNRGEAVFKANCILCHGVKGNGKGRASVLFKPPPADLTRSDKNEEYKTMIIRYGGAAMGRSEKMPIWGQQLTDQEIEDVVKYIGTLLIKKKKVAGKAK